MPKTTSRRTKTLTVRVGPTMRHNIEQYAEAREMTIGEFVRYCVRVYMDTTMVVEDEEEPNEEYARGQRDLEASGDRLDLGQVRRG